MNQLPLAELSSFHQFLGEKLRGPITQSPENVLDEWRTLHPDPDLSDEDVAAIQEALDDMDNGDTGIPYEEFDQEFRARHGLPKKQ